MPLHAKWSSPSVFLIALLWVAPPAHAQSSSRSSLYGMWSDPPATPVGWFCAGGCTDAGIEYLNRLLDDPANDSRPFSELMAKAITHQQDTHIVPRLTDTARKTYPLDPADDPSFLRCEPYGLSRQIRARHQLEIREPGDGRIELRYGEWDARRTVYMDGRPLPASPEPTLLGYSVGRWDGDALVIESVGIRGHLGNFSVMQTDQLRGIERFTRLSDGSLLLTATLNDPATFREPVTIKRIWRWAPEITITAYEGCEVPTEFKRR